MKHIDEFEIQAYLDRESHPGDDDIRRHLENCPRCREKVRRYQDLYRSLAKDEIPELPDTFAGAVVAAVERAPEAVPAGFNPGAFVPVIAVLMMLAGILWFLGVETWIDKLTGLSGLIGEKLALLTARGNSGPDLSLVLGVALALLLVGLVDRIIRRTRGHSLSSFIC